MSWKFETRFEEFIEEIDGERIPTVNAPREQRAHYIAYALFGKLGWQCH
jgi:hypothetical protein